MEKEFYYYIQENVMCNDKSLFHDRVSIFKIPKEISFKSPQNEGPFKSLEELKKNSMIFKMIAETNPRRVSQLLNPKNIIEIAELILVEANKSYSKDFITMIEHTWRLQIKKKELSGIHFFDTNTMKSATDKIFTDLNGVWEADVYHINKKDNITKKKSSFFPIAWEKSRLIQECEFAVANMKKISGTSHKYESKTLSGIPVVIIVTNGELATIYPIFEKPE